MMFDHHPKYPIVNLSRIDPAFLSAGMHGKKHFLGNNQPLLCTSVVVVDQCYLNEGNIAAQEKLQKVVKASLLEGEFEHLIGVICMIILEHEFKRQLYKDVLGFTTSKMHIMHVMLTLMSLKKYLCTMAFGGLH
jgi:hypothetical protein